MLPPTTRNSDDALLKVVSRALLEVLVVALTHSVSGILWDSLVR